MNVTVSVKPGKAGAALLRKIAGSIENVQAPEGDEAPEVEAETEGDETTEVVPPKRKRGRPPKASKPADTEDDVSEETEDEEEAEEDEEAEDEESEDEEAEDEEEVEEEEIPKAKKKLTLEGNVIPAFRTASKKAGKEKVQKLLKSYGVTSVRDLPEKKFGEVLQKLAKLK